MGSVLADKHDAIGRLSRLHDIHGSIYKLWLALEVPRSWLPTSCSASTSACGLASFTLPG